MLIRAKALDKLYPLIPKIICSKMKQLPPAKCYAFNDERERVFKDEAISYEKGVYYGEWNLSINKPHGFGYLI